MKNLKELKSKIEKLNHYLDYLIKTTDQISNIDKENFLAQIRALYDLALFGHSENVGLNQENKIKEPEETEQFIKKTDDVKVITEQKTYRTEQIKEPVVEQAKIVETILTEDKKESEKIEIIEQPLIEKTEIIVQAEEKVVIEINETPVIEIKEPEIIDKVQQVEPITIQIKEKKNEPEKFVFSDEFEELFVFKLATDLASKLSEKPIPNLNKALAVNEKLNYVQQLFAGETNKFGEAYNFFNEAASFEIARKYMESNLIVKYGWMSREKKNTAKEFIKLIRRRYL